jgi:formylglycine-generating enzyme required for sulfatase activity
MTRGFVYPIAIAFVALGCLRAPGVADAGTANPPPPPGLTTIPGGSFVMGDDEGDANETPKPASVGAFSLMRLEVTNHQFSVFAAATGHRTDAEKSGYGYVWDRTWERVPGADWRHPNGTGSSIDGIRDHPVVQVSARDAAAFCAWHGLRLPSEAEWEFAARGAENRPTPGA